MSIVLGADNVTWRVGWWIVYLFLVKDELPFRKIAAVEEFIFEIYGRVFKIVHQNMSITLDSIVQRIHTLQL